MDEIEIQTNERAINITEQIDQIENQAKRAEMQQNKLMKIENSSQ